MATIRPFESRIVAGRRSSSGIASQPRAPMRIACARCWTYSTAMLHAAARASASCPSCCSSCSIRLWIRRMIFASGSASRSRPGPTRLPYATHSAASRGALPCRARRSANASPTIPSRSLRRLAMKRAMRVGVYFGGRLCCHFGITMSRNCAGVMRGPLRGGARASAGTARRRTRSRRSHTRPPRASTLRRRGPARGRHRPTRFAAPSCSRRPRA
jgi:hypothetical protein